MRPPREDLAVLRDTHFHPGDRLAHAAEPIVREVVRGDDRRRFREPVSLENDEPGRVEELGDLGRERRASRDEIADVAACPFAQFREHQRVGDAILHAEQAARLVPREFLGGPAIAHTLGPEEDSGLEPAGGECVVEHARVDLFVQAGHAHHQRRLHFAHVHRHRVHRLGVGDAHAVGEQEIVTRALEDVAEREKAERGVGGAHRHRRPRGLQVRVQVVLREHHALRIARRPRGVNQRDELVGTDLERGLLERRGPLRRIVLCPQRFDVGEREIAPVILGGGETDDPLQSGHIGAYGGHLACLIGGRHEDGAGAGIVEEVGDLFCRQRRVHRHVDNGAAQTRIVGDEPLGAVLRQQRHAILRDDAESGEAERDMTHALQDGAVTGGFPHTVHLVQQGIGPVESFHRVEEQPVDSAQRRTRAADRGRERRRYSGERVVERRNGGRGERGHRHLQHDRGRAEAR